MAIKIGSNFTFQGEQPNFERDRFATKAAMKAFPETSIDDGHLSYCVEDGNTYQFKSSNAVDATTGKWRLFKADVDLSAYATTNAMNTALNKKVDIAGKAIYSETNVKVATIPVPTLGWRSVTVTIDIRCRYSSYNVDIHIISHKDNNTLAIVARKHSNNTYNPIEKIYYYLDKSIENNYKVIIFYANDKLDTIYGRIIGMSGQYNVLPILNMEVATTIPEGAVEINYIGYNGKNLFYATPKDVAGDPKFRAIDVADIPDLSGRYATKAKAFTTDNVSTEPNQFVAGPATTKGNLSLRKIDVSDLPDLRSKYQVLDNNGFQLNPKITGGTIGASGGKFLIASIPAYVTGQISPDWYYATDGTLQDITTKIPKVVLDDAVSTDSPNGVKNSAITNYVNTVKSNVTDLSSSVETLQTDFVDLRNKVNAMPKTVFITQAAYDALTTKDANTIYYING